MKENKKHQLIWPKINKKIENAVLAQLKKSISIYNKSDIFERFENKFAKYYNRKFSLLCNSGTTAIHSMFVAINIKSGDEVICPAYTFFATVTPILFTGAKPILCDCDENGNISPSEIEKKINKKTKAVIVTHMWGVPAQIDKIKEICKKNKITLLEDCSHAHGAIYKKRLVGSFGDISAWSLQGSKNITGGEGGIITTNNKKLYERALLLGHYNKRCFQEISSKNKLKKYWETGMGLKYRAHPLAVAIAEEIFDNIEKNNKFRKKYAKRIIQILKNNKKIDLPPAYFDKKIEPSWYSFVFFVKESFLKKIKSKKIITDLKKLGVENIDKPVSTRPLSTMPLFQNPAPLFPSYCGKNVFSYKKKDFPMANKIHKRIIKIPVGTDQEDGKVINFYAKKINKYFDNQSTN